jgi:hypothetical protein
VALLGVLVNVAVFRGLNDKSPVLQVNRDVPAGSQLAAEDFTTVRIGSDGSFRAVSAGELDTIVGTYAKVRLVAGTLLAREALQAGPLVAPGASVIAVTVPPGEVPTGLRERSAVRLVLTATDRSVTAVDGVVVGLPVDSSGSASNVVSVSVEVAAAEADRVAAADRVRLVLLEPSGAPE